LFGAGVPVLTVYGDPVAFTDGGYQISIAPERTPRGELMCYVPRYKLVDRQTADMYANLIGVNESFSENSDSYVYESRAGRLEVDKWINMLRFEGGVFAGNQLLESDADAVSAAVSFARSKYLRLSFEETKVKFDGDTYLVSFIDRIGNLKNYAFPTRIRLDNCGNVVSMDYFFIHYDRLKACSTISMNQALRCLPPLPDLGCAGAAPQVLIDRAQLVYYYEDSIVQPAYLFEGRAVGGKLYECFVKASKYI